MEYDVVVIGGGSAGYAAARTVAGEGLSVAVVDGSQELGGLCILRGCMPSKALLHSAEIAHHVRESGKFGIRSTLDSVDFKAVMDRKNALIEDFASYRRGQLESSSGFDLIRSQGRFSGPNSLTLSNGDSLNFKHAVIATGSRVSDSPLPSLDEVGYITSDGALELREQPRSLIVLGGGVVAVEMAQFFARLGVEVTIIQRNPQLVKEVDADAGETLLDAFEEEGICVFTGTELLNARKGTNGKVVEFRFEGFSEAVEADEILFALGRSPNTENLALDAAGIVTNGGRIVIDERSRTNVPHIYAAGDCASPYEVVHIAIQQGEIAGHNILHPDRPKVLDYRLNMSVVFTDPQVATLGLTEKEAQALGTPYKAASYPFNDHGKSLIMNAMFGFVKLLADPESGEILGASCVGPYGGELLHEVTVAMAARMTVAQFAAVPHYHPTLAEIWTYPAEDLADEIG